jgi:hypothetical protein
MTEDDFVLNMEHIRKYTGVRKDKPVLNPLDTDQPHVDMTFLVSQSRVE